MTDATMLPMGEEHETCRSCRWWVADGTGWGACEKVFEPDALFYPDGSGGLMTHEDFHCNQYEPGQQRGIR